MNDKTIENIISACLENISRDEFLSAMETEKDRKIGLMLHSLGFKEAMDFCSKMVEKVNNG